MKILIDARSLGEKPSGVGRYIFNMCIGLLKYPDWQIILLSDVSASDEMKKLKEMGISVLEYGRKIHKGFALFSYFGFVQKAIYAEKPDVFWEANNMVPVRLENPFGKLAVTIHDVFPVTLPKYYGRIYPRYFKYGVSNTLQHFDMIIYDSRESKAECEKHFPNAKEKTSLVGYVIVDDGKDKNRPEDYALDPKDNHSFLYIGNIELRKGSDILLDAFDMYRQKGGTKKLRIGGNIREEYLHKKLNQLKNKYPDDIIYLGYISDGLKAEEFEGCDTFLFPSRAEGFGIPILEAMSYKKKVIATDLMIFKELMGECISYIHYGGDYGKTVAELADKMSEDIDVIDTDEYESVLKKFESERITKNIAEFFEKNKKK